MSDAFAWGVVRPRGETPQPAARIGDDAVLLRSVAPAGGLADALAGTRLNELIELGPRAWRELKMRALDAPASARVPIETCETLMPVRVTDYVDSTRRSRTPPTSDACSAPRARSSRPTGVTCRSATTAARRRSW